MYRAHDFYLVKRGSEKKSWTPTLPYNRQSTASYGIAMETVVRG